MGKLQRLMRYDWPLHFILLLTNWLPDNTVCLKFRGYLAHFFIGFCGHNLRIGRNIVFYNPQNITIGADVYIAYGSWFAGLEKIIIGDEAMFGPYCIVVSGNHTKKDGSFRFGQTSEKPIRIGNGTWIGSHVTITAGADVGSGCQIGANSVVLSGLYPSNSMIAGNPASILNKNI